MLGEEILGHEVLEEEEGGWAIQELVSLDLHTNLLSNIQGNYSLFIPKGMGERHIEILSTKHYSTRIRGLILKCSYIHSLLLDCITAQLSINHSI